MNAHNHSKLAGPVTPLAGSASHIGAGCNRHVRPTGEAGAPNLSTYSRCPDCNGPFSYRIVDEDTGCRYPVDDGEHYCEGCDSLWTDDALELSSFESLTSFVVRVSSDGTARIEL